MKKNQLFQFSLTVICSMVLAACGSSGGSSNPTTQATNTTPAANPAPTTPATTPAATNEIANAASDNSADKDKQVLTDKAAQDDFLGYKHVNKNHSDFIINTNGTADTPVGMNVQNPNRSFDTIVVAEPKTQVAGQPLKTGYLEDFDFRRNNVVKDTSIKIPGATPAAPTLVTGQTSGSTAAELAEGQAKFVTHLHVGSPETTGAQATDRLESNAANTVGTAAPATIKGINYTKTKFVGLSQNVSALVYAGNEIDTTNTTTDEVSGKKDKISLNPVTKIYNYTDRHFSADNMVALQRDSNGKLLKDKDGNYLVVGATGNQAINGTNSATALGTALTGVNSYLSRSQLAKVGGSQTYDDQQNNTGTKVAAVTAAATAAAAGQTKNVAEVYGYRTFATAGQYEKSDTVTDTAAANLPLENKRLSYVQYGRVTSHLSDQNSFDQFRDGALQTDGLKTYVVDYGIFGSAGTEDHYFYRGVDGISKENLAKLQAKGGQLEYWGHAVAYGLDNSYNGGVAVSAQAPTAIGAGGGTSKFVSGNHAYAKVDMATGKVNGSIYNTWFVPKENDAERGSIKPVDLVRFEGELASNGNIAGTSYLTYKTDSKGLFGANLYGPTASEIGGVVSSLDKTDAGKWGAVFGATTGSSSQIQNATQNSGGLSGGN